MNIITSDMIMFYKKGLFSKKWKNCFFSLRSDGIMTRYRDQDEEHEEASLDVKQVSISIAEDVIGADDRPPLDLWMDGMLLMRIPYRYNQKDDWWLLFLDYSQLGDWMENISLILTASEVQKDFVIRNRLTHNTQNQFCQHKNTLKYRDEACHIPPYSINTRQTAVPTCPQPYSINTRQTVVPTCPPNPEIECPPRARIHKYEYFHQRHDPFYRKEFEEMERSESYRTVPKDKYPNEVQIPIRRANSYGTLGDNDARTDLNTQYNKGILKKSSKVITETSNSHSSSIQFIDPDRVNFMKTSKLKSPFGEIPRDVFSERPRDGFGEGPRDGFPERSRDAFGERPRDGFVEGPRDGFREGPRDGFREKSRDGFRERSMDRFIERSRDDLKRHNF